MSGVNFSAGLAVRVFAPFALGYFLVSIFRSINAVIAPELARDFDVGATALGFAVSAFFLSATLFQVPYGVLLDRYDPRRLYASVLLFSALGAVLTAVAESILVFALGRVLIALGIAASAVTSFKVYSVWFPAERLPLVNGFSLVAGGCGLMAGTAPVEVALHFMDWRAIHMILAALLVASAALVTLAAPQKRPRTSGQTLLREIKGLHDIASSMLFWRAAPVMAVVIGIFGALTQLWAGPWVRDVAGLSGPQAARLLLVLAAAMTISGLVTGVLMALAKLCGLAQVEFTVATAGLFALVLVLLFLQWTPSALAVHLTWALFGFVAALNLWNLRRTGTAVPTGAHGQIERLPDTCLDAGCVRLTEYIRHGARLVPGDGRRVFNRGTSRWDGDHDRISAHGHRLVFPAPLLAEGAERFCHKVKTTCG